MWSEKLRVTTLLPTTVTDPFLIFIWTIIPVRQLPADNSDLLGAGTKCPSLNPCRNNPGIVQRMK